MNTWYRFATVFTVDVAPDRLWAAITAPGGWLAGYADVLEWDMVSRGGLDHVGDRYRIVHHVAGPVKLRYDLEVVASRFPDRLAWRVTGDVAGTGTWELEQLDDVTDVRFTWEVTTTKRWMNALTPVIRGQMIREYKRSVAEAVGALAGDLEARVSRVRTSEGKQVAKATAVRFAAGLLVLAAVSGRQRSS